MSGLFFGWLRGWDRARLPSPPRWSCRPTGTILQDAVLILCMSAAQPAKPSTFDRRRRSDDPRVHARRLRERWVPGARGRQCRRSARAVESGRICGRRQRHSHARDDDRSGSGAGDRFEVAVNWDSPCLRSWRAVAGENAGEGQVDREAVSRGRFAADGERGSCISDSEAPSEASTCGISHGGPEC